MKTNLKEDSQCRRILEIQLSIEETENRRRKIVGKLRKIAAVPGFRPGKVPTALLESRFKNAIIEDMIEDFTKELLGDALKENNLKPVNEPKLIDYNYDFGKEMKLSFDFEVLPEFELKEYKGIEVEFEPVSFDEKFVEDELNNLREKHSKQVPIENRPVQKEDLVFIDYVFSPADGSDEIKEENFKVVVKEDSPLYFLTEKLLGLSEGDNKEFEITFPDDYYDIRLKGKNGNIKIKINQIKEVKLPELDDEFAKTASDVETLDELKEQIRTELKNYIEKNNREGLRNTVLKKLTDSYDFEVPQSIKDTIFANDAKEIFERFHNQGLSEKALSNINWSEIRKNQDERLNVSVREFLLLMKIGEKEKIEITDEDVDKFLKQYTHSEEELTQFKQKLIRDEEAFKRLKSDLHKQKVMDFLVDNANIVPPKKEKKNETSSNESESKENNSKEKKTTKTTKGKPKSTTKKESVKKKNVKNKTNSTKKTSK